jgi:hypothetical protein
VGSLEAVSEGSLCAEAIDEICLLVEVAVLRYRPL